MAQKVLIVDNYDSFTYNLVQELGELGADPVVFRNDAIEVEELKHMSFDKVVISPGPGRPENAGISVKAIKVLGEELSIPVLGVCLGHQSLAYLYGGKIVSAPQVMHGKVSEIIHNGKEIFSEIDSPLKATRYHSLIVDRNTLPTCFEITAESQDGLIMGLCHNEYPLFSVQFHPESLFTTEGMTILNNFLSIY